MKFHDLIKIYEKYEQKYKSEAYKHISELFDEAKRIHKQDWLKLPTPGKDYEQSWKSFKGHNLEKLILYIIQSEINSLGLKVVRGDKIEKTKPQNLTTELSKVKRNVAVDFGEFGLHSPDVDLIIYDPKDCEIIAILSSKVTLRERIAQTGYWKIKLNQDKATRNIKVFFITLDEDKTLNIRKPAKKGRAIVEVDTDGSYVMSKEEPEESKKVKKFDNFLVDLKKLIYAKRNKR